jgi:signal peptidase II
MSKRDRLLVLALVTAASVGCDQGTKRLAEASLKMSAGYSFLGDSVRLQYAENPGAFLSLGAGLPDGLRSAVFTLGVGLLLAVLLVTALGKKAISRVELWAYALVLSGGLSNLYDRVFHGGRVVDFMNLGIGSLRTGIFNVADLAIVGGVVLLALPSLFERKAPAQ